MGRLTRQNHPGGPRELIYGFAIMRVGCNCSAHVLDMTGNTREMYCKKCGIPTRIIPNSKVYSTMDDLMLGSLESCPSAMMELQMRLSGDPVRDDDANLQDTEDAGEADNPAEKQEDVHSRMAEQVSELSKLVEERNTEVSRLLSENESLKIDCDALSEEANDLRATVRHLKRELDMMRSVNVRGISEAFLEFAAGTFNAVMDPGDEKRREELVKARLERLRGELRRNGAILKTHDRGEILGDSIVDAIGTPTDDPLLDMRVARITRFGCSFENEVYPDIPETLDVYRFNVEEPDRKGSEPETGDGETRIRAVEE